MVFSSVLAAILRGSQELAPQDDDDAAVAFIEMTPRATSMRLDPF
jgi:hypothetical protein